MAAQDYFNDSSNYYSSNNARPYPSNAPYGSSTIDHTFDSSPHSFALTDPRQNSKPKPPKKDEYAASIPLQPSHKLDTSPHNLHNQNTQYPPSPEAKTSSELLPKRPKKKKGFFS